MEHRLHQRIQTHLAAVIHNHVPLKKIVVVRNLSPDGAFLEFEDGEGLPTSTGLTIEFTDAALDGLRLGALVVHATGRGIGVIFHHRSPRLAEYYGA
ncbi:MAG: hypothetical protein RRB22_02445 [Gammaproteobacteria bacterium]|nr:hypothetical protein [Gammaproteobacteria bacterium]